MNVCSTQLFFIANIHHVHSSVKHGVCFKTIHAEVPMNKRHNECFQKLTCFPHLRIFISGARIYFIHRNAIKKPKQIAYPSSSFEVEI